MDPATEKPYHERVALEIANQITGPSLHLMGVKDLMAGEDGGDPYLQFKIRGSRKGNVVRVLLTPMDVYRVTLFKTRGVEAKEIEVREQVYCEDLRNVLESMTGLYLTLFPRKR